MFYALGGFGICAVIAAFPNGAAWYLAVFFAALISGPCLWRAFRIWRCGVVFDHDGLVVNNPFRTYRLRWSDVTGLGDGYSQTGEAVGGWALRICLEGGREIETRPMVPDPKVISGIRELARQHAVVAPIIGNPPEPDKAGQQRPEVLTPDPFDALTLTGSVTLDEHLPNTDSATAPTVAASELQHLGDDRATLRASAKRGAILTGSAIAAVVVAIVSLSLANWPENGPISALAVFLMANALVTLAVGIGVLIHSLWRYRRQRKCMDVQCNTSGDPADPLLDEIAGPRWGFMFWYFLACTVFIVVFWAIFFFNHEPGLAFGSIFFVLFFAYLAWRTQTMRHLKFDSMGLTVHKFFAKRKISWSDIESFGISNFDGKGQGVSSSTPLIRLKSGKQVRLLGLTAHPSDVVRVEEAIERLRNAKSRYNGDGVAP
jgi:hypothetical protein